MSTGAGLVGGVFNNGDIIQIAVVGLGIKISADKANAIVGGINTLIALPAFSGVEVSQNVSIGPLSTTIAVLLNLLVIMLRQLLPESVIKHLVI
ncbi:hypothetical protein [Rickettsia australis]|uniref:hypothetical protein n=1 Tax=Rickettsia australis TaxID=787 RepID=UPI0002DA4032|nr:hypothetical protein [Rickettsia australis]